MFLLGHLQVRGCVRLSAMNTLYQHCAIPTGPSLTDPFYSVQVNIPAESGDMGILASHVPSIEQLKPGLVEVIQESGPSKQFFRMSPVNLTREETR